MDPTICPTNCGFLGLRPNDNYCLRFACTSGHLDVVKYLVSKGANIRANNDDSIFRASHCDNIKVVEFLLKEYKKNKEDLSKMKDYILKKHYFILKKILLKNEYTHQLFCENGEKLYL